MGPPRETEGLRGEELVMDVKERKRREIWGKNILWNLGFGLVGRLVGRLRGMGDMRRECGK